MQDQASKAPSTNVIHLDNDLSLAFIKRKTNKKSADKSVVSVTISHGHFAATAFPEGFAHLFEHMLFNASSKYRNIDALDQHLYQFHGNVNGWTQDYSTNIQLTCDTSGLLESCNILFDRLFSPLFLKDDIARELAAIDAEFASQLTNPVRELISVQKASCNPEHPFARFTSGNKDSFKDYDLPTLQQLLQTYHQQVMQGKFVNICVGLAQYKASDDEHADLQQAIYELLEHYASGKTADEGIDVGTLHPKINLSPAHGVPFYLPEQLGVWIDVKQHNQQAKLFCSYAISKNSASLPAQHRDSVLIVISHLIESKHLGGLFHNLYSAGLIYDIQCYYKTLDHCTDELVVCMQVSKLGESQAKHIQRSVQAYIDYLRRSGIEKWRFREKEQQFKLNISSQGNQSLLENCVETSIAMATTSDTMGDHDNFDHDGAYQYIDVVFSHLNISNLRVVLISERPSTNMQSRFFNTPYSLTPIDNTKNDTFCWMYTKPRQNPYMANEYPMLAQTISSDELTNFDSQQVHLKFYQDMSFGVPNGECYISISDPNMFTSLQQIAIKRVWLACLDEHLRSEFFDVELASIHFRVYPHLHGISIHTGGLSERQLLLCIELVNVVRHFKAPLKSIERQLEKQSIQSTNKPRQRPLNQLFAALNEYYQRSSRRQQMIFDEISRLTAEQIHEQQQEYFKDNFVESLLIGNWHKTTAERFFKQLSARFTSTHTSQKPDFVEHSVKKNQHFHLQMPNAKENCLIWHIIPLLDGQEYLEVSQSHTMKLRTSARAFVLEKLCSHIVFSIIRQKYKMAYTLGVGYKPIGDFPGISFYVESPNHDLTDVYSALLEVIDTAIELVDSDDHNLESIKNDLVKQVSPQEKDIAQKANRAWQHFADPNPIMSYRDLATQLQQISVEEIRKVLKAMLNNTVGQVFYTSSQAPCSSIGDVDCKQFGHKKR